MANETEQIMLKVELINADQSFILLNCRIKEDHDINAQSGMADLHGIQPRCGEQPMYNNNPAFILQIRKIFRNRVGDH